MKNEINNIPLLSVVCLSYNHIRYIKKALDSILAQKTDFPFEILINDDASVDGTIELLHEYEKKYSNIRVIYHEENQYSKGISPLSFLIKEARGQYLAFCECDDYFLSNNKLQIQFDVLNENPEYVACVHAAEKVNEQGEIIGYRRPFITKEVLDPQDIVYCIGQLYALNSLFCRKSAIEDYEDEEMFKVCTVGDIPLALHLSLKGNIYYLDDSLSAYRVQAVGSWSQNMKKNTNDNLRYISSVIETLSVFDRITNHKYHDAVSKRIETNTFHLLLRRNDLPQIMTKRYRKYLKIIRKRDIIKLIYNYMIEGKYE